MQPDKRQLTNSLTTAWRVFKLRMEDMEARCKYMNLNSGGQSTRHSRSPLGLGDLLTASYAKNLRCDETFHKPSDLDTTPAVTNCNATSHSDYSPRRV